VFLHAGHLTSCVAICEILLCVLLVTSASYLVLLEKDSWVREIEVERELFEFL